MNAAIRDLVIPSAGVTVVAGTIIADDIPVDYELEGEELEQTVELDQPFLRPPPPAPRR